MKFVLCLSSPLSIYKCHGQCLFGEVRRLWWGFLFFSPSCSFLQPIIKTTAEIKFSMISSKPCKSSGSPFQVKEGLHLSLSPKAYCRTQGEQAGCCCGDLFCFQRGFFFFFFFFSPSKADSSKWKFFIVPSQLQSSAFSSRGCNLWSNPEWVSSIKIAGGERTTASETEANL